MEKYKNLIIIAVVVLIMLVGGKYIYSDYSLKMGGFKNQRAVLEDRKRLLGRWNNVEDRYQASIKQMLSMDSADFLNFVEKKAYDSGVSSIDYSRPYHSDKGIYWEANVDMGLSSPYSKVINFIKAVEEENIKVINFEMNNLFDRQGKLIGRKTNVTLRGFIRK